jgi:hypothetical protein
MVAIPKVTDFNQIITLDLNQFGDVNVLCPICSFTRFCQGVVFKDKSAPSIVEAINFGWNWRFGFPLVGFCVDNGSEFPNGEVNEYASKCGFEIRFGPTYSPWCNGLNERNNYLADVTDRKIMEVEKKQSLTKVIEMVG